MGPIDISLNLLNAQIKASLILGFLIWIFDKNHYSRSLFIVFISLSFLFLIVEKIAISKILSVTRKKNLNTRNLLIVGTREKA